MPRTVCVDSMICIWGIKKIASKGQEDMIEAAQGFFETLAKESAILLLPAPVVTELLMPVPASGRGPLLDSINRLFRIAPVDTLASVKAAELWHETKNWKDLYKKNVEDGIRNKFKFDLLIAAIAITRKVNYLYTHDEGLQELCKNQIDVGPIPDIGMSPQLSIFDKNEQKNKKQKT